MTFRKGESGNPKGRKPKSERHDGWGSLLTGLGTSRDKRTSVEFVADPVTDIEAREMWRSDDLSARAVEAYPDAMLRAGYDVSIQADEESADDAREQSEAIEEAMKRLNADEACRMALCFERAYGGGAIFPVINDSAGDLSKPLNENLIPEVRALVVFEPRELQPLTYYNDPLDPRYGMPEVYTLQPIAVGNGSGGAYRDVHESRLIIFPGKRVTRQVLARVQPGWGDSELTLVREIIRDFNAGFGSASHLLQDFGQAVLRLQGLHAAVAADKSGQIKARLELLDVVRSVLRAIPLDAGGPNQPAEDFERKATPMTGFADVLDRMIYRLASALEMPASLLMGMSPGGLNATGDSDVRQFYDRVSAKQDRYLRPRLERLIRLVMLSKSGPTKGVVPDKWCVEFCPLWQPSQKEVVDARLVQAQVDEKYFAMGLPAEDILNSRFSGDGYSFETKFDADLLARAIKQESEAKATADAALAAKRGAPGAPDDDTTDTDRADGNYIQGEDGKFQGSEPGGGSVATVDTPTGTIVTSESGTGVGVVESRTKTSLRVRMANGEVLTAKPGNFRVVPEREAQGKLNEAIDKHSQHVRDYNEGYPDQAEKIEAHARQTEHMRSSETRSTPPKSAAKTGHTSRRRE